MSLNTFNNRLIKNIDDLFFDTFLPPRLRYDNSNSMKLDMKETNNQYIVTVDIPGVDKNKININIVDNLLTISAERLKEIEENNNNYYYSERFVGTQTRTIQIPNNVDIDNMKAKYIDGVLTINIPILLKNSSTTRTLKIE